MLPLASLAARRLRNHHHICATCRIATRSRGATFASPALHLQQYGQSRYFSATLARADDKPEPSDSSADSKPVRKRKKEKATPPAPQPKKAPKATKPPAETKTEPAKPATKKKRDSSRNLKVLQGALAALKNVLDAQNISVAAPAAKSQADPEAKQPTKKSERKRGEEELKASGKQTEGVAKRKVKAPKTRSSDKAGSAKLDHGKLQALRKALASQSLAEQSETGPEAKKKKKSQDDSPADDKKPKASSSFVRRTKVGVPKRRAHAKTKRSQEEEDSSALDGDHDAMDIWKLASQTESAETDTPEGATEDSLVRKVSSKRRGQVDIKIESIYSDDLKLDPIEKVQPPVPPVSYGLDRVLFNPGVYHLQDPRSRVFNFDPYLSKIMPIQEFDFNALKQYITSSKDEALINIARENNKRYTGSTSSMTAMLAHFHYLLSSWREINPAILSKSFNTPSNNFTKILTSPAAIFLHWKDGVYAIDADKEFDTANILSMLGKSMEKLLTLSKEDYERYRTVNSDQISEEERNADEAYHYTGLGDFMMRSQLDAHDPRIPGTGMFDLKTRAVISIRMDAEGFQKGLGYEIRNRFGDWESFEREYYDMIRSAFLKYSLQVRMGRMDGIFVAFHNTQRIFGFQYIPLPEMDLSLHGTSDTTLGDKEFKLSLGLLNEIMDRASKKFPEQSLRLHFETRPSQVAPFMYIFAKPVGDQEIKQVQEATKAKIEEFERNVLGLGSTNTDTTSSPGTEEPAKSDDFDDDVIMEDELDEALAETSEAPSDKEVPDAAIWEDVRSKVEDAMEDDELGVAAVREAIEDALEQSGLLEGQSPEETRNYVDSLLNALSPDVSPEQTEGIIADPDDVADSQDHTEERLVTDETAEFDDKDTTAEESREDVNAESNTASNEADSDPSVSIPIVETSSPNEQESQSEQVVAPERDQDVDSAAEESVSVTSPVAETNVSDSELDQDEQAEELKELSGTSSLSNLKDLIVRMAQNIDGKEVSERDMDDEDDSKLREFERILGQMMTDSRAASSSTAQASDAEDEPKESGDAATESSAPATKSQVGEADEAEPAQDKQLLGMVLTIRNRVNGSYVQRPENLDQTDKWDIEYNIQDLPESRAWVLYDKLCGRRRKALKSEGDRDAAWYEMFQGSLDKHTKAGRKFREEEEIRARQRPVHVVGQEEARTYEETFGGDSAEQASGLEELGKEE
ncbi:mitochondrial mRNA processing protein [Apiospora rasikravindrae]|uniref:Mitochondrial mRNA processing protein n=1 Tax=Apiospora rasikravindrae TaxID=990691 RepID=A0ABR1RSA6_9PEZI